MNNTITLYQLTGGTIYALAADIENYAARLGYTIRIDANGQRHSGTRCNECIRYIASKHSTRRMFDFSPSDVVSFHMNDPKSLYLINMMIGDGVVHPSTVRHGYLDVYTVKAASIIISVLLGRWYDIPQSDMVICTDYSYSYAKPCVHKWTNTEQRKLDKLFAPRLKESEKEQSYLQANFTQEEQEVIRRYQAGIRETRENGTRAYIKRKRK